ncbi:hypothetical protein Nepgr_011008 [Nepenthes gracilis]|uniref:Uncharacterized protein n=1 Tax=Nepenthes gracilis TaxID=150966 RepID=A0AAD3SDE6_NEPGR|nr:hypothetical protein Nepgr_011008 [Nepenthes gracilis]
MATTEEGFDEWDDDFLEKVAEAEELAIFSSNLTQPNPTAAAAAVLYGLESLPQRRSSTLPPYYRAPIVSNHYGGNNDCHSPPRELSQRVPVANGGPAQPVQEPEIERLKTELGRVSKQLVGLEQECSDLRKERDKNEEQLKSIFLKVGSRNAGNHCPNNGSLESGFLIQEHPGISLQRQNANSTGEHIGCQINTARKTIGIQTDKEGDCANSSITADPSTYCDLPLKLLSIWSPSISPSSGRNFVAKLFEACALEICALFNLLGLDMRSRMDSLEIEQPTHVTSLGNQCQHSSEAAGVSRLYFVLAKIRNDLIPVEALLEVLLDLCNLENVLIVHRSLRILHVVLDHLLAVERKCCKRDNVKVEGLHSKKDAMYFYGSVKQKFGGTNGVDRDGTSSSGQAPIEMGINYAGHLDSNEHLELGTAILTCHADRVHIFKLMCQIAMKSTEENLQVEAVSIMNTIVMRSNAYTERAVFGGTMVFKAVGHLLRKEAGLYLQKEAVHLLYLLLNCPKLLATFCSGSKDGECIGIPNDDAKSTSFEVYSVILERLSGCMARSGNSAQVGQLPQDLRICRNTIVVLAFLASSGKLGFEILLFHKLSNGANFLSIILQVLASEVDAEALEHRSTPEIFQERMLLIREALILLNRLASHPSYSTSVLQALTGCTGMASLSIDIATRLSKKSRRLWKSDDITRQMQESEVAELAQVFRKRVFAFLGESI